MAKRDQPSDRFDDVLVRPSAFQQQIRRGGIDRNVRLRELPPGSLREHAMGAGAVRFVNANRADQVRLIRRHTGHPP
jgi:hypothetical protein